MLENANQTFKAVHVTFEDDNRQKGQVLQFSGVADELQKSKSLKFVATIQIATSKVTLCILKQTDMLILMLYGLLQYSIVCICMLV